MARCSAFLSLLLIGAATAAAAQEEAPLQLNDRIRVMVRSAPLSGAPTLPPPHPAGTIVRIDPGGVALQVERSSATELRYFPLEYIDRIEISAGRTERGPRVRRGMLRGALVGAATGLVLAGGFVLTESFDGPNRSLARPEERESDTRFPLWLVGGGTAAGVVGGGLVGLLAREKWREVPLERLRVGFEEGALRLGMQF